MFNVSSLLILTLTNYNSKQLAADNGILSSMQVRISTDCGVLNSQHAIKMWLRCYRNNTALVTDRRLISIKPAIIALPSDTDQRAKAKRITYVSNDREMEVNVTHETAARAV